MNEIIAQLAEHAAQESAVLENELNLEVSVDDKSYQIPAEFIRVFAELIIRECMQQCEPEAGLKYSPNALSSRTDCRDKIKNRFDIE
jgi:hypothetical protein